MYAQYPISHGLRFHKLLHQNQNISSLQISWNIIPEPKYFMVSDCMGYYTRTKIFHGYRFHGILHQNPNISWLRISWDISSESKYFMAADFMRYYTIIKITYACTFREIFYQNGCRCHEIFHQNYYISLLQISWDITQESKYLMAADIMRY